MAGDAVLWGRAFAVVGTVVEFVDPGAVLGEFAVHPGVQADDIVFAVVAAGNAALVGDDEHAVASIVEVLYRFDGPWHPLAVFRPVEVPFVAVEHAVAVEEGGRRRRWVTRGSRHGLGGACSSRLRRP